MLWEDARTAIDALQAKWKAIRREKAAAGDFKGAEHAIRVHDGLSATDMLLQFAWNIAGTGRAEVHGWPATADPDAVADAADAEEIPQPDGPRPTTVPGYEPPEEGG